MGEPAIRSAAERATLLDYARRIIEASRNDEDNPLQDYLDRYDVSTLDALVFELAQDLVATTSERDTAELNIAAWLEVQAGLLHPKIDKSCIHVLRVLVADVRASRWKRTAEPNQ